MSLVSHVMTASHLKAIQPIFTNGIPYHVTDEAEVKTLLGLIDKYSRLFDPRLPELDQAFLRLNVIIRHKSNGDVWSMAGGALPQRSMSAEIDAALEQIKEANPDSAFSEQVVVAWVLNEWDRFSVVVELNLMMESK